MFNDYNNDNSNKEKPPYEAPPSAGQGSYGQQPPQQNGQYSQQPPQQNGQYGQNYYRGQQSQYPSSQYGQSGQPQYPPAQYSQPYNNQYGQQYNNQYGQPYQQPYNQQYYRQPYVQPTPIVPVPGKGLAAASMVCGIISLLICWSWITAIIGLGLGIAACAMGGAAKKKGYIGGMATAGIVTGILGIVFSAIIFLVCSACLAAVNEASREYSNYGNIV